jgi:hypothetical protein
MDSDQTTTNQTAGSKGARFAAVLFIKIADYHAFHNSKHFSLLIIKPVGLHL